GAQIDVIPCDDSGQISLDALREMMDERVKLIAVTHVPTNGGLVNPAAGIGQIAREAGVWYLLDACQSVGQMPVNVDEIGCDFLSATGRKFLRGPRGTGFLYVRRSRLDQIEPPFLDLQAATWTAPDRYEMRPDARRFEAWESSFASKVGLAAAIDYAMSWGLDEIYARIKLIAGCLRDQLRTIPGVTVRDLGVEPCGIVTFTVDGYSPDEVKQQMAAKKINVTVSRASSTLLDMQARELTSLVRASVHYINTEAEVGTLCEVIRGMR
ncbi:MAG TPA: aminotransferase class V-fold PLP-dependent enzyme, partial [Aggregatilineaceae bacterium]|nr:aminotransferase class V-fold PLP-dependent enzyme [Aggregatilineaceae bacterium]